MIPKPNKRAPLTMYSINACSKENLRQCALELLKSGAKSNNFARDKKINHTLQSIIKKSKAKKILAYLPMPIEANIMPTINMARKRKIQLFVPFVQDISFKMVPFRLPLKKGKYNIKSVGNSYARTNKIDMALVPAVALDADFKRVGFGKGMYDRFFSLFSVPFVIFVQRIAIFSHNIVTNHLDSSADILVSAQSNYIQGNSKNDSRNIGIYGRTSVGNYRVCYRQKDRPSQVRYLCGAVQI